MEAWVVDENSKGLLDRPLKSVQVHSEKVREALKELRQLLPTDPEPEDGTLHRWRMEEVELTVELTGEGSVKLLGGATVGITGGISVVFKRVE